MTAGSQAAGLPAADLRVLRLWWRAACRHISAPVGPRIARALRRTDTADPTRRRRITGASVAAGPAARATRADPADPGTPGEPGGTPDPVEEDVWQILGRAQAGDAEAFGQLYDRYVTTVYRFIYYRLGDRVTAEDLTSETFVRALRRIGSVSNQGRDPAAWFVTIARNLVLDHVKSARYRLEITTDELLERGSADSPEQAVLTALTNARLVDAIRELSAEQRECVVLRFLQGFSVAETAEVMGKNEGAVKAMQHRAVRRLYELVAEDLG